MLMTKPLLDWNFCTARNNNKNMKLHKVTRLCLQRAVRYSVWRKRFLSSFVYWIPIIKTKIFVDSLVAWMYWGNWPTTILLINFALFIPNCIFHKQVINNNLHLAFITLVSRLWQLFFLLYQIIFLNCILNSSSFINRWRWRQTQNY